MSIAVKDLVKRFGQFLALDRVSLDVPAGSLVALLGPSGSGKTTLLRIIAGLEVADHGTVCYDDDDVTHRSVRERNVGFVFQHYALFRHMTVYENIAFGLRVRRWSENRIRERVQELLALVRLENLGQRYPAQLSGGQKQRVALVRALAVNPSVLLLDEPFGALDAKVRAELRNWLRTFHDETKVTSIFVTHDQEEAFEVADRVVIMRAGRIEQAGTPAEVFEHPANAFVMDFLGNVNVFPERLMRSLGEHLPNPNGALAGYVRPHELTLDREPHGPVNLQARIIHINPAGSVVKVRLVADEFSLAVNVDLTRDRYRELQLKPGEMVYVAPNNVRVFAPDYSI